MKLTSHITGQAVEIKNTPDSYAVSLQIEEIENEQKRDWAIEELFHLEELYEALSDIDNMSIEFMFDDMDQAPFLTVDQLEIHSVTKGYRIEIPTSPTKYKPVLELNKAVDFISSISTSLSMAA